MMGKGGEVFRVQWIVDSGRKLGSMNYEIVRTYEREKGGRNF